MEPQTGFQRVCDTLAKTHHVPDILSQTVTLVFILESPHVQELKYGAPVSGASGATMTKHLFGEASARLPLGLLVKKNLDEQKNRPRLNRIGLVNVSNIPLQGAAYRSQELVSEFTDWMRAMEHVRSNNQTDVYRDPLQNEVQSFLVESMRTKLLGMTNGNYTLVPCGRFAQKFFRLANVASPRWTVINGVPHPSYNSWDRPQYRAVIEQVQRALPALPTS